MPLNMGSSPERRENACQQGWLAAVLNQGWTYLDRIPRDNPDGVSVPVYRLGCFNLRVVALRSNPRDPPHLAEHRPA